jgi:hypothetical protein
MVRFLSFLPWLGPWSQLLPLKWGNKNMVCSSPFKREKHENWTGNCRKKERKTGLAVQIKTWFFQFLPSAKFLLILSSINFLILAPFPFGPRSKKGFKLACNWSSNFKHLAIVSLQTRAKKNPSRGRNPCFHTRYSNGNILSFWYRNQAVQKPKFIYASDYNFDEGVEVR